MMPERAARGPRDPRSKVMTQPALKKRLAAERRAGRSIVFTNGVFDLLHPGHVSLLNRARRLGDLLVVALNSDASVRRLKGPGRPFIRQADRAFLVAALEAVDYVVIFGEPTPLRTILGLEPDVLVKGGDWKKGTIVGREEVESWGGRVVRLKTIAGLSTTRLAGTIRARATRQRGAPRRPR